jgi:endonuclease III
MTRAAVQEWAVRKQPRKRGGRRDASPLVQDVLALLKGAYEESRLGNKRNPLDELVYIILSLQTNEARYQEVYRRFRDRFPRWSDLLDAAPSVIASAIAEGGLSAQKARHLRAIVCQLQEGFGEVSLRRLKHMTTERAEEYLCSLPGVGIKTARCVLIYSLGMDVFRQTRIACVS